MHSATFVTVVIPKRSLVSAIVNHALTCHGSIGHLPSCVYGRRLVGLLQQQLFEMHSRLVAFLETLRGISQIGVLGECDGETP